MSTRAMKDMDVDYDHVDEVGKVTEVSQSALSSHAVALGEEEVDFDYDLTDVSEDEAEEGHEGHEDDKEGAGEQGDSEQRDGEQGTGEQGAGEQGAGEQGTLVK